MAQRGWLVRPDHEVDTFDPEDFTPLGPVAAVSQQALAKAVLDGVVVLDRAGGVLSVTVSRTRTGVPGERVTTGAMVEWKDRTDARPQPEHDGPPILRAVEAPEAAEPEETAAAVPVTVASDREMPEVDDSSVPVELRGV